MSRVLIPIIVLILIFLMDFYGFTAMKTVFGQSTSRTKWIAYSIYWSTTLYIILFSIYSFSINIRLHSTSTTRFMFGIIVGIVVSKLLLTLLLGIEDFFRFLSFLVLKFSPNSSLNSSRRQFLDMGFLMISSLPIFAFIYGMVKTAFEYQVFKKEIFFPDLPECFDGFKIVQLSDIHSGSLSKTEPLIQAVQTINAMKPDLFVFTGDLVNNVASEYVPYINIFKEIKAKHGQYSILGNHDYGDYVEWDTEELKQENLNTLKEYQKQTNWNLLINEHVEIEQQDEKIALIGIENWGAKMHFHRYGNLKKAYAGTEKNSFKILLSHDPSHWDAEVREKYKDIQLTLSGHTHGMQFGIETKYFRFSPVQWVYKQWAGLYKEATQQLYVNRGFGYIGYPGRVGIHPEISELVLRRG